MANSAANGPGAGLDPARWAWKVYSDDWVQRSRGKTEISEPATGGFLGKAGMASADEIYAAAKWSAAVQREWAKVKPAERARVLRRAGNFFINNCAELLEWAQRENRRNRC